MTISFIILVISLFLVYFVNPENKINIILYAIFTPIIYFVTTLFILSTTHSQYYAGAKIAGSTIPIILSGISIYYYLNKKYEKEFKTPIVLIFFVLLFLYFSISEIKTNMYLEDHSERNNHGITESIKEIDTDYGSKDNCDKNVRFDNRDFGIPKFSKWVECANDLMVNPYVKSLQVNSKILAFYIPDTIFNQVIKENKEVQNFPKISLSIHNVMVGIDANQNELPDICTGIAKAFQKTDLEKILKQIKSKTNDLTFEKPSLIKFINSKENIKTLLVIFKIKIKEQLTYSISYINVCLFNDRIMIVTYSQEFNEKTSIDDLTNQNNIIIEGFNNCNKTE